MGKFMLMPKLDMSMEEGVINKWLIKKGDKVKKGDLVVEIETGKVNLEVDNTAANGTVIELYAKEGETIKVNTPIMYIGEEGEVPPSLDKQDSSSKEYNNQVEEQRKTSVESNNQQSFDYDLAIIGGGPGGYVCAIRAAQLGAKVVVFEKDKLGGTCLNRGCIPTKSLVQNANTWREVSEAGKMGVAIKEASFDWTKIINRKNQVVNKIVGGVEGLLKKNNVDLIKEAATIGNKNTVEISNRKISTKYIVVATGTVSAQAPIKCNDKAELLNAEGILELDKLPSSLLIIGGGVIGVEMASIFSTFGVKVTIVEMMPSIISMGDEDVTNELKKELIMQGVEILTKTSVTEINKKKNLHYVKLSNESVIEVEKVLVAVGRKPVTSASDDIINTNEKGYIIVDDKMKTNIDNIYAIGDIIGKTQLAHVASTQGIIVAENLFGENNRKMNYDIIPSCVFTHPELAWVGMTEKEVKRKRIPYKASKFPFKAIGKALAMDETTGFVKIISDSRWDEILGVHIIGPHSVDLIAEAVTAMQLEATTEELANTIHAHPTLSEAIMEACEGIANKSIHI